MHLHSTPALPLCQLLLLLCSEATAPALQDLPATEQLWVKKLPQLCLLSLPCPTPKVLLAVCLLAPEKATPQGLLLIGGFLLFLLYCCILLPHSYFVRLVFNRLQRLPDLTLPTDYYHLGKKFCLQTKPDVALCLHIDRASGPSHKSSKV